MKLKWVWALGLALAAVLLFSVCALADDYVLMAGGRSKAAAVSVGYDQLYAAEVTESGQYWYKFTAPGTNGYTWLYAKNNSISRSTYFYVYSQIEEKLYQYSYNNGSSGTGCIRLSSGTTYYIKIDTSGTSGYYQFKLTFVDDPDNSSVGSATPIALNTAYSRTIGGVDTDMFEFTTNGAGSYSLSVSVPKKPGSALNYAIITGVEEQLLKGTTYYDGTVRGTVTLNAGTKYYVKIWSTAAYICDYSFTVINTDADSNSINGATPIALNTEYARTIDGNDTDWFVFTTDKALSYSLCVSAPKKPNGYFCYGIFTAAEEKLVSDSFYYTGSDMETLSLSAGTKYYVKIWSTTEYTCDYTMKIRYTDVDSHTLGGATPIALNTEYKRTIDGKETDCFVFTTSGAGSYTLSVSAPNKPNGYFCCGIYTGTDDKLFSDSFYYTGSVSKAVSLDAGTKYYVKIWSTAEYTCDYHFTVEHETTPISKAEITLPADSYVYTGKAIKPEVTVKMGGTTLKKGTDYTVKYSSNKNVGIATVTVTGKGDYGDSAAAEFRIKPAPLTGLKLGKTSYVYTGKAFKPAVTVKAEVNGKTVTLKSSQYTVTYENNKAVGKATVTVTGKGNYGGTLKKTFKITPVELKDVKIFNTSLPYTGKKHTPVLRVRAAVNGKTLTLKKNRDYTVTYTDNIAPGTATVTVKGKGNYTGTLTATFKINKLKMSTATVTLSKTSMTYTGKELKPKVTVKIKVDGKTVTLTKGTDYTVTYKNNIGPGTATVVIKGKGNFTGTIKATFTIRDE